MQSLVWKRYAWLIGGQTIPILPNTLRPDFKFQKVNYRNQMVRDRFYRKLKKDSNGFGMAMLKLVSNGHENGLKRVKWFSRELVMFLALSTMEIFGAVAELLPVKSILIPNR